MPFLPPNQQRQSTEDNISVITTADFLHSQSKRANRSEFEVTDRGEYYGTFLIKSDQWLEILHLHVIIMMTIKATNATV